MISFFYTGYSLTCDANPLWDDSLANLEQKIVCMGGVRFFAVFLYPFVGKHLRKDKQ